MIVRLGLRNRLLHTTAMFWARLDSHIAANNVTYRSQHFIRTDKEPPNHPGDIGLIYPYCRLGLRNRPLRIQVQLPDGVLQSGRISYYCQVLSEVISPAKDVTYRSEHFIKTNKEPPNHPDDIGLIYPNCRLGLRSRPLRIQVWLPDGVLQSGRIAYYCEDRQSYRLNDVTYRSEQFIKTNKEPPNHPGDTVLIYPNCRLGLRSRALRI
jgi:hypothetical protein